MKNKLIIGLLGLLTIVSAGCSKSDFLDVNTDPNNPADVPPRALLPATTYTLAFTNGNELARVASLLVQHNAGTANQALGFDIYNLAGNFDNAWNFEIYVGALPPINTLIAKTQETGPHYAGVAKIQKAYLLSIATDLWGDVPYSQAGNIREYPTPRFDKQEDIYQGNASLGIQSLFVLVKEGIADLEKDTPEGGFELGEFDEDLVFNGDVDKWIAVGNTLLLKLAITISNVNPTLAKSVIDDVLADGRYIKSNGDDFDVPYGTASGSQSPIYAFNITNRETDMMMSTRFLNIVDALSPNVRKYVEFLYTTPSGNFVTYENGAAVTAPSLATRSRYDSVVTGTVRAGATYVRMINNTNRAFILAESAIRLGTAGNADALFKEGIRAAMFKAGMGAADVDDFFANNAALVTLSGTDANKLKQILTWKYISNVTNPLEAYNDYRRTGIPDLNVALNASGDDPSVIPKRYTYPPNETSANPNVPSPRPLTNQKVWWGM
ncbi:SusD/RagB family nutrient-binding outer membrane lipoprotein [Pseudoflavitalea rhizosphaerae]|uniref:SusD/RagB family nutrient-binding outer membrane lipoprotein n=1 Tax=Pseudoflavitalea rhizosphaerae TaxID=1884793 RepID=UPI000F8D8384|nr:SusD/RagB family nutrient-binding outer membrane lipoprotein [Pseudoflavitalea rhizosphaerae]